MQGTRLGPYQILSELGTGGMGRVFRAEVAGVGPGLEAGSVVALKVIHPHLLETPGFFKRFLREAEIGRTIEHENVVRTYDCDALLHEGVQQNFLVMEYVEGRTLRDLLEELERVPEELCRHIGCEVAKGLAAIHEAGVVHRDLKPENVLITMDHVVKVMDLGVARLQDEIVRLSQAGTIVGSLEYAAPEQFRAESAELDGRADLHALGVVLYELSTGRHPHRAGDVQSTFRNVMEGAPRRAGEVNPQLSPFFEEVVHVLLAKNPDDRFDSAAVVAQVLEEGEASAWWQERAKALRLRTRRPLRRIRIPRETALYGRDEELSELRALYDAAKVGRGRVLLIEGEAGIGKTRLVDEFVSRLREEGEDLNFLFGSYPPGGAATADGAFSTAYRQHFAEEGLEETLEEYLSATPILIPAFAALLRGEDVPTGAERLTKGSLQTVFVHATRALAAERTTIVLIDDLHFAPEEGLGIFASLALAIPKHRVLLVGTARPELPDGWAANLARVEPAAHKVLTRLGAKDLAHLLEDAFCSRRLAEELSHRIAVKSDGNPFFAFEIIRSLREGGLIALTPGGSWVTTKTIDEIEVPSTVTDLVHARLATLDDDERSLLDVASCCGFEFDPLVVAEVLGLGQIPAMQRLARIESRHRLVRSAGRRFVFDHHQLQEALYGGLPLLLREPYHAAIARAMERSRSATTKDPRDLGGAVCVDLCEHFLEGGEGERARHYLDAALDHLEEGYLNDQAASLAERALAVKGLLEGARRVEVLLRLDERLYLIGRREAQKAALAEAESLCDPASDTALLQRIELAWSQLLMTLGSYPEGLDHARCALDFARAAGDRKAEASAATVVGTLLQRLGRYPEARERQERALVLSREIGSTRGEASAMRLLGSLSKDLGRYPEAEAQLLRSRELSRAAGDRVGEANATGVLGNVYQSSGDRKRARDAYAEWLRMALEMGDRLGAAAATGNLGILYLTSGDLQQAEEHFGRHLALAEELGDRQGTLNALANLGLVFASDGRLAESCGYHERALDLAREIGNPESERYVGANLAELLIALGRKEDGGVLIRRAHALAVEAEDPRAMAFCRTVLAGIAQLEGDDRAACDWAANALALYREMGDGRRIASTLLALARSERERGNVDTAASHLTKAVGLARENEAWDTLALAAAELARLRRAPASDALAAVEEHEAALDHSTRLQVHYTLWRVTGDAEHLREAHGILAHLVEHAPEEHRASMIQSVPLHREILEAWAEQGDAAEGAPGDGTEDSSSPDIRTR